MEISKEDYFRMKSAEVKLTLLEHAGVDNWDWYGDALNPDDEESFSDWQDRFRKEVFGESATM